MSAELAWGAPVALHQVAVARLHLLLQAEVPPDHVVLFALSTLVQATRPWFSFMLSRQTIRPG